MLKTFTAITLAACAFGLPTAPAAQAMENTAATAGYHFDAEHIHSGSRWGYANLYRAPSRAANFDGCNWMRVPTAYGLRFRPACGGTN
jgi:hypothetical protein